MASWLEELDGFGKGLLGAVGSGAAERIKSELADKPSKSDQPETQIPVTIQRPLDGPASKSAPNSGGFMAAVDRYKYALGGVAVLGVLLMIRGRQ